MQMANAEALSRRNIRIDLEDGCTGLPFHRLITMYLSRGLTMKEAGQSLSVKRCRLFNVL